MKANWFKIGGAAFVVLLAFPLPSQAEDVRISTYYPSPFGNYRDLEVTRNTYLLSSGTGTVGVGYANGTALANPLNVRGAAGFMNAAGTAGVTLSQAGANGTIASTGGLAVTSGSGFIGILGNPDATYPVNLNGNTRVNGTFVISSGGTTGPLNVAWNGTNNTWTAVYA